MCEIPADCLGVIALHVDDPTLRAFRLVSTEFCAIAAAAAKTRAAAEKVTCFGGCVISSIDGNIAINVAPNWEIRLCKGTSITSRLPQFDRGVIRAVVEQFPIYGTVHVSRMGLYISRISPMPQYFCGKFAQNMNLAAAHITMCGLPADCIGVIALHIDEPTLRSFRLVSVEFCAIAAAAAKVRACAEIVHHYDSNIVLPRENDVTVRVSDDWVIRLMPGCQHNHRRVDRGVVREMLKLCPQYGCVYYPKMNLYISYDAGPTS